MLVKFNNILKKVISDELFLFMAFLSWMIAPILLISGGWALFGLAGVMGMLALFIIPLILINKLFFKLKFRNHYIKIGFVVILSLSVGLLAYLLITLNLADGSFLEKEFILGPAMILAVFLYFVFAPLSIFLILLYFFINFRRYAKNFFIILGVIAIFTGGFFAFTYYKEKLEDPFFQIQIWQDKDAITEFDDLSLQEEGVYTITELEENFDFNDSVMDQEDPFFQEGEDTYTVTEFDGVTSEISGDIYPEGINVEIPEDWVVHTEENPGNFVFGPGGFENLVLAMHENGPDPTQVRIFIYPLSLEETIEVSKKTSRTYSGEETTMEEVEIGGTTLTKRTYSVAFNDCESIQYIHYIDDSRTGVVEVSGMCPTHPEGYDELKRKVAESVTFTN